MFNYVRLPTPGIKSWFIFRLYFGHGGKKRDEFNGIFTIVCLKTTNSIGLGQF